MRLRFRKYLVFYLFVFVSLVLFLSSGFASAAEETKPVKVITDYRSKLSSESSLEEAKRKKLELEKSALQVKELKEERVRKSAGSNAKAGDVIVVFRNTSGTQSLTDKAAFVSQENRVRTLAKSMGGEVKKVYAELSKAGNNVFTLIHSDTKTEEELLSEFRKRSDVVAASLNYEVYATGQPNDPYYKNGSLGTGGYNGKY